MEVVIIVVVAVLILGLLAARLGTGGSVREQIPEWPDRSHQSTLGSGLGNGDGGSD